MERDKPALVKKVAAEIYKGEGQEIGFTWDSALAIADRVLVALNLDQEAADTAVPECESSRRS